MSGLFGYLSTSAEDSFELAKQLGRLFRGGEVVALEGELGSGKTLFARGLVCGLGCPHYEKVNSPTYVLEQVYEGRYPVRHYDMYRIGGGDELLELGFDEYDDGRSVIVIEWADRVKDYLPPRRLWVEINRIEKAPEHRKFGFFGSRDDWGPIFSRLEKNE
jgi:tRNA threonylcarbamoyladenosine biosynthesis protein TsaE